MSIVGEDLVSSMATAVRRFGDDRRSSDRVIIRIPYDSRLQHFDRVELFIEPLPLDIDVRRPR